MPADLVGKILEAVDGKADYGDVRFVRLKSRFVSAKNGRPSLTDQKESSGVGIRVLWKNSWGFASTADLSKRGREDAVRRAFGAARASAAISRGRVRLAPEKPVRTFWKTPLKIDPWQIETGEQMDTLISCEEALRKDRRIFATESRMEFFRKEQVFGSTEGSLIESVRVISGGGLYAKARHNGLVQRRSYPSPSKDYASGGYEAIQALDLNLNAERVREEAVMLLQARPCPAGSFDLILKDSLLALQIHESIGHAAELDRVFGHEDNLGGRTYFLPGMRGRAKIGSDAVTIVANRRGEEDGAGFVAYDDEGVPARETVVVDRGVFRGYLTGRETARLAGLGRSSGSMIAEDWSVPPIIRMTGLSLLPGRGTLEDLVRDVRDGLLMDCEASWSIDEERGDFQLGAEIAWRVRNGKIREAVRNPLYRGHSLTFWKKCRRVAGETSYGLTGFSDCGKGGPYQQAFVSHGSAPALFRKVDCYASGR
jgi:TldD protein